MGCAEDETLLFFPAESWEKTSESQGVGYLPGPQLVEVGKEREVDHGEADVTEHRGTDTLVQPGYALQ